MRKIFLLVLFSVFLLSCDRGRHEKEAFDIRPVPQGYVLTIRSSSGEHRFSLSRSAKRGEIHIPARRVVVFSSTHVGFICRLDEQDKIIAVPSLGYICCPKLRQRSDSLSVVSDEIAPDMEKIVSLRPDVVFISGFGPGQDQKFQRLIKAGIAVIPVYEYKEISPLDRARWIEVFGAVFDKYSWARRIYDSIEHDYLSFHKRLGEYLEKNSQDSPLVLVNIPYRGTWYVPGGQSYMARLIKDAGGKYLWEDNTSTGSLPLSFEQVYDKAKNATILLNPGTAATIDELLAVDRRLHLFEAVSQGQVYNFTKHKVADCYDFWEKGVIEPHKILSDLINIFYPDNTVTSHTMYYYQKLK